MSNSLRNQGINRFQSPTAPIGNMLQRGQNMEGTRQNRANIVIDDSGSPLLTRDTEFIHVLYNETTNSLVCTTKDRYLIVYPNGSFSNPFHVSLDGKIQHCVQNKTVVAASFTNVFTNQTSIIMLNLQDYSSIIINSPNEIKRILPCPLSSADKNSSPFLFLCLTIDGQLFYLSAQSIAPFQYLQNTIINDIELSFPLMNEPNCSLYILNRQNSCSFFNPKNNLIYESSQQIEMSNMTDPSSILIPGFQCNQNNQPFLSFLYVNAFSSYHIQALTDFYPVCRPLNTSFKAANIYSYRSFSLNNRCYIAVCQTYEKRNSQNSIELVVYDFDRLNAIKYIPIQTIYRSLCILSQSIDSVLLCGAGEDGSLYQYRIYQQ